MLRFELVNTSRHCLFVLGIALAATAPAYSQGHMVPNGVTYSQPASAP